MTATGQQNENCDNRSLLKAPPPRKSGGKQSLSLHPPGSALHRPEKYLSHGEEEEEEEEKKEEEEEEEEGWVRLGGGTVLVSHCRCFSFSFFFTFSFSGQIFKYLV